MKSTILLAATLLGAGTLCAQNTDTTTSKSTSDTVRIGSMVIIKKTNPDGSRDWDRQHVTHSQKRKHNIETSFVVLDLGFSNFRDKTNYASADARDYARVTRTGEPAFTGSDFNLRNGKSINFSLYAFMQRVNLVKHVVNLQYGLGVEWNNFRFENNVSFKKGNRPYVFRDSISFSKNKLGLAYATVPLMLNFNTAPKRANSFTIAAGVSAGLLIGSNNKQKSDERGKQKNKGNYDIEKFKFQYVAEVGYGGFKLYATYAPKSIFERGLDIRTFNVGVRLGDWQ